MAREAETDARRGARGRFARAGLILALAALLGACGPMGFGRRPAPIADPDSIADAVPKREPLSARGNPESYVVDGVRYYTLRTAKGFAEQGVASWYGSDFHGRSTSSGEPYDMYSMTAAHKQLPLPTYVQVRNLENGRTATVKVNDRGPFKDNRVIDLSYAAALKLGIATKGTAFVEIRAIEDDGRPTTAEARVVQPKKDEKLGPAAAAVAKRSPTVAAAVKLYVQCGSFVDRSFAQAYVDKIRKATTSPVGIRELKSNNKVFYRVEVGPLADTDAADQVVKALDRIGIRQHSFVTN